MTEEEQVEVQDDPGSSVHADQLAMALESLKTVGGKDYVEVLSRFEGPTQIKLRLRAYDLEAWTHQFLPVVFKEELRNDSRPDDEQWVLHICRQYMYDEVGKKLKFFWNFIVSASDIEGAVRDLCRLIDMFVARVEDMEVPVALPRAPRRAPRPQAKKGAPVIEEEDLFSGSGGASGVVVEDGQVVSIPLLGGANRNAPEGGLFEKGKSPKGAHSIGGSR